MKKVFDEKKMTASEAVRLIQSGDKVYVGTCSSVAYSLMDALWERRDELENIGILLSQALEYSKILGTPYHEVEHNPFYIQSYFVGKYERVAYKNGMPMDYTSFHLSQIDVWSKGAGRPDVCFLEVSPPDENGYCSYGPSGNALHDILRENARVVILEVNKQVPYICGERSLINISEADAIVEVDRPLSEMEEGDADETSDKISDFIMEEIPDGATIQLGLGKVSTAIGYGLMHKNDLGIHSELMSTPMMHLMQNGNVTNRKKGFHDGVSVFAFAFGNQELYNFLDYNPQMYGASFPYVNDPRNIAKNKRFMSINTAMSVDIYGQVAADSMGWHQQSAVGGQIDFVKGAQWSEGGKSFIALPSSFIKNGKRVSKICLTFPEGTAVTTPRSEVQYVVTEYGCVNLKTLNMSDRVRAMISLAHPDFRDQLTDEAKMHHLI